MTSIPTLAVDISGTIDLLLMLPPEQRLEIGERLLDSVNDEDIAAIWEAEIVRRIDDHEAGRGKSYPASEVMAEIRALIDDNA